MGRPSKLTDDVERRIILAISGGAGPEIAARHGGIAPSSHFLWIDKGRRASARIAAGEKVTAEERRFSEYSEHVEDARREWELGLLAEINLVGVGKPYETTRVVEKRTLIGEELVVVESRTTVERGVRSDWRALERLLKWRRPEEYGDRLTVEGGISEEEQAMMLARALEGALSELGIEQTPDVRRTVARHLSLVADEAEELAS